MKNVIWFRRNYVQSFHQFFLSEYDISLSFLCYKMESYTVILYTNGYSKSNTVYLIGENFSTNDIIEIIIYIKLLIIFICNFTCTQKYGILFRKVIFCGGYKL